MSSNDFQEVIELAEKLFKSNAPKAIELILTTPCSADEDILEIIYTGLLNLSEGNFEKLESLITNFDIKKALHAGGF